MMDKIKLTGETASDSVAEKLYSEKGSFFWAGATFASGFLSNTYTTVALATILTTTEIQAKISKRNLKRNLKKYFGENYESLQINKKPDAKSITKAEHLAAAGAINMQYVVRMPIKGALFGVTTYLLPSFTSTALKTTLGLFESGNEIAGTALFLGSSFGAVAGLSALTGSFHHSFKTAWAYKRVIEGAYVIEDMPPPEKVVQSETSLLKRAFGIFAPAPAPQPTRSVAVLENRTASPLRGVSL